MSLDLDREFYPVTDRVDWEPLRRLLPPDLLQSVVDQFMFMQVDSAGRRYYKHSDTRQYLVLDGEGRAWDRDGQIPVGEALRRALGAWSE